MKATTQNTLAYSVLIVLCSLLMSAGMASAQGPDVEGVERWSQLDIGMEVHDEVPELPNEIFIDERHTVTSPTVIRIPDTGAEGQAEVSIEILEGEADVYVYTEESWQPMVDWTFMGPMTQMPIAIVPSGKVEFSILIQRWLLCLKKWQCTLLDTDPIVPSINYNRCIYGCVFEKDILPGCSGLTPGVSKSIHSETVFTDCEDPLEFWTL